MAYKKRGKPKLTSGKRSNRRIKQQESMKKANQKRLEARNNQQEENGHLAPNIIEPAISSAMSTAPIRQNHEVHDASDDPPQSLDSPISSAPPSIPPTPTPPPPILSIASSPNHSQASRSPPILSPIIMSSVQPSPRRRSQRNVGPHPPYSPRRPTRLLQRTERKNESKKRKIENQSQLQVIINVYGNL